jgi:hypothetical protein
MYNKPPYTITEKAAANHIWGNFWNEVNAGLKLYQ